MNGLIQGHTTSSQTNLSICARSNHFCIIDGNLYLWLSILRRMETIIIYRKYIMVRVSLIFFSILFLAFNTPFAKAQNYEAIFKDFNAQTLTKEDKRFLQAALAFEGHYLGLLDGDWGNLSKRAFSEYSSKNFGTAPANWHTAILAVKFLDRYKTDGWNMQYYNSLGMSVLLPMDTIIQDAPTKTFTNFHHSRSSLSYSIGILSKRAAQNMHDYTARSHELATEAYSVRKTNFAISVAEKYDGTMLYTRSNFVNGKWSTIVLSANKRDANILNAVSSSIAVGNARPLIITNGGRLEEAIRKTIEVVAEAEAIDSKDREAGHQTAPQTPSKPSQGSSGSGFFVSNNGHVLTNAHVVDGCHSIWVDGEKANLVIASKEFDLAILKTSKPDNKDVAIFSANPAMLNSDVTVVGYPYAGVLSGLNVTRGAVSSLKGLGGKATTMQISAPVQSGNSGGPLLASDGEVVGVVVSKLNATKVEEMLGDTPQNINFAIRGEIAKLFLAQNGINPLLGLTDNKIAPEIIADRATKFTTFIECE